MFLEDVSRKIVVKRDVTATNFANQPSPNTWSNLKCFTFWCLCHSNNFLDDEITGGSICPKLINHHLFYCHSEMFINSWPKKCLLNLGEHLPCSLRKDYILEVESILLTAPEDVFWRERRVTSTKSTSDRIGEKTQQVHQLFFFNLSKSIGWLQFLQISFVAGEKITFTVTGMQNTLQIAFWISTPPVKHRIKKRTPPAVHNSFG